ncbi:FAD-binding oxidoreductase [Defluviimonas sp. WL0050]|uniref:FAD-binding oxidoreductase n=1 Tax=Albidovulum litorale TaxID=2984134 RepID=A0ABT2ZMS9_9RHOB|nr:FAD-binding oxidoreductase [Defluviimonas sp. WL0050]MCV2872320.1 FAD-binding oxidoreductase [Defluviimonas sp. WL0050]
MAGLTRRGALLLGGAALGGWGVTGFAARLPVLDGSGVMASKGSETTLNDASLLSETPIHRHLVVEEDPGEALVARLRAELKEAAAAGRPVNIGAARHSMGGQAIPRDGHAVTFRNATVEPDPAAGIYRVHAGARWSDVIAALDPIGFSPKVMQSNHDFGVAATFSVNAHGWPAPLGPMGSTVLAVTMVMPDGTLLRASRDENAELFRAAMGGYGLIGLITELEVEMAPNLRLDPTYQEMPGEAFGPAFATAVKDGMVDMAYGRLNVDRSRFFEDALMITYRPSADQSDLPPASTSGFISKASRHIFRAQLGRERVKRWRWRTETDVGPRVGGGPVTRNSLLNEPVITLDDRDPTRTDILHEYFVPPERFADFLTVCRDVIPGSYQELLNVTLRWLEPDIDSLLAFAPGPRIAAVMLFSQEMTARAEADMTRMTEALIDRVIALCGTYYLPYRPHARPDQFTAGYARAHEFVAAKRAADPGLLLRNALWDRYMGIL